MKKLTFLIGMIATFLLILSPAIGQTQTTISIQITEVRCDYVRFNYTLSGDPLTEGGLDIVATNANTQTALGFLVTQSTPPGTYSGLIVFEITLDSGTPVVVTATARADQNIQGQSTAVACQDYGDGGEPEETEVPEDLVEYEMPAEVWSGFVDGRLNPDRSEYYTIYCTADVLEIWRSNPPPSESLYEVQLVDVAALRVGQRITLSALTQLERITDDQLTVYGSDGNLAPTAGSKSFSRTECLNTFALANNGAEDSDTGNRAPHISVSPTVLTVQQGWLITYTVTVEDPDSEIVTISTTMSDQLIIFSAPYPDSQIYATSRPASIEYIIMADGLGNGFVTFTATDSSGASSSISVDVAIVDEIPRFGIDGESVSPFLLLFILIYSLGTDCLAFPAIVLGGGVLWRLKLLRDRRKSGNK